jgi:hypothetical protein
MEKTTEELHCLFIVSNLKLTVAVTRARNRLPMTLQRTKQMKIQRRYDMNGRFQMQGGKKLDFAEIDQCKPVLLGLSLAGWKSGQTT